jgi:transposase
MGTSQVVSCLGPPFELRTERLGPLPLVNHFLDRLEMERLFEKYVPTRDRRCTLEYAKSLGVLLRSLIVEREPIYRQYETVQTFAPSVFALTSGQVKRLRDDQIGRALDQLFVADRASLLTQVVVAAAREFGVRFDELHNDSTSIRFTGQYRQASGRSIRGRRAPWITYGHSKDHRPDLKQLLFVLTTSADGGVPVQFRCEDGNRNDALTHIETWEALCQVSGGRDFLYVADSKLCTHDNMSHIDRQGGRFITVLPRSRSEDGIFRKWIQTHQPDWEPVWDRPNPRRKYGRRDCWFVCTYHLPSREGWPVIWVYSTLLEIHQKQRRLERLAQAIEELDQLDRRLCGPRPRLRSVSQITKHYEAVLGRYKVGRYLRVKLWQENLERFRQEHRGRAGPATRYRRELRRRHRLRWTLNKEQVVYDEKSDGMYPLLSNDQTLTPRQILEAHKRQPTVEKRFEQTKNVNEIAPVLLKNEGRIEALFLLLFFALLVQYLIEREVRQAMKREDIEELPIYPEERLCHRPTAQQILKLFALAERHQLRKDGQLLQTFEPELTDLQKQVLSLMKVPARLFCAGQKTAAEN